MIKKLITLVVGLSMCLGLATPVLAQDYITADDLLQAGDQGTIGEVAGLGEEDITVVIGRIIRAVLGFLGVVAVIIIIWGGFLWMTSGGDTDKVSKARKFIIMGIVGLAIVLAAYAIASFVITALVGAVTGT
jgi:hypothetical protein